MTDSCTTQDPPMAVDPPLTRAEFNQLMRRLETIERRGVRTETKVQRLMEHHGLDGHGNRLNEESAP